MKKTIRIKQKNRARFKVLALLLALLLTATPVLGNAQALKDETIYADLNYDGSVNTINVVNRLYTTGQPELLTDYGMYSDVVNLVGTEDPTKEAEKITWRTENAYPDGFYYVGTIDKQLPFTFDISYYLNGNKTKAPALAGANGRITIKIEALQNQNCPVNIREDLMAQIALNLDLDKVSNVINKNATMVVVGQSMTLSYTILSGSNASFVVSFDANDFEMSGMNITLLKGEITVPDNIQDSLDEIEDGFDDMCDGMDEMIDGTDDLKGGLETVVYSARKLDEGLEDLETGAHDMANGIGTYKAGLIQFEQGIGTIATGSTQINSGLNALDSQSSGLVLGYAGIKTGLDGLSAGHDGLVLLAQSLLTSTDPNVVALANGIIAEDVAIKNLADGMVPLNAGLDSYTGGVADLAAQYGAFDSGIQSLIGTSSGLSVGITDIHNGANLYAKGVTALSTGLHSYYAGIRSLPNQTQKLIDGQIEFKEGLDNANDEIKTQVNESMPSEQNNPVSFTSPSKNKPTSVQYIMLTPAIQVKAKADKSITPVADDKNVWIRFVDLFR